MGNQLRSTLSSGLGRRPGFFTAYNDSSNAIIGVSTYSVIPFSSAPYFRKVQCFCFEEQRLRGKEKVDMPVLFYLDPAILDDPALKDCYDITLAYTFFEVEEEEGPVEWDEPGDWEEEEDDSEKTIAMFEHNLRRVESTSSWAGTVDQAHLDKGTPGYDKLQHLWDRRGTGMGNRASSPPISRGPPRAIAD